MVEEAFQISGENLINNAVTTVYLFRKRKLDPYLTPYTKNNLGKSIFKYTK